MRAQAAEVQFTTHTTAPFGPSHVQYITTPANARIVLNAPDSLFITLQYVVHHLRISRRVFRSGGHRKAVCSLDYSDEYRLLVTASFDHDVCVWSPYADKLIYKMKGTHSILCDPIASGLVDSNIWLRRRRLLSSYNVSIYRKPLLQ